MRRKVLREQNIFHRIVAGPNPPQEIYCLVEIPRGCTNKYGVVPQTLTDNRDPLDIMVLSTFPTFPGCLIVRRPIGALRLLDSGRKDDKIVAVPRDDPRFDHIVTLDDLIPLIKNAIRKYQKSKK